jgi:putative tricarboxylic transport membrane protein
MRLSGYPIVPLIIALILGPIAEEQMLRSLQLGNGQIGYFVGSPIAIALWVVIVTTFGWGILRDFRARREAQGEPALESSASDD